MTNNIKSFVIPNDKRYETLRKLLQDGDWWASKLAMHTNTSREHTAGIVREAEEYGLTEIQDESDGKKIVELTENGKKMAQEFERLERVFQEVDNK